jgi:hypothetical protein
MLNFVENLLENERDPRSGPMNDQDHSLSLSDPDRSLVLSHFLTNFLQNLASCHTAFSESAEFEKQAIGGKYRVHPILKIRYFRRQFLHTIWKT